MANDSRELDYRSARVLWADGTEDPSVEAALLNGWLCIRAAASVASYPSELVQQVLWHNRPSIGMAAGDTMLGIPRSARGV